MIDKTQILQLLTDVSFETLAKVADNVRRKTHGDVVHLRAIIEFSNYCKCNCLFCGIRRDNRKLTRYRMTEKEIVELACDAVNAGFKTVVLQSGEDPFWSVKKLSKVVREIKKFDVAVTLSVGELSYKDYAMLREAGADRYLLKFETSDKKLFKALKPDTTFEKRVQCLKWLKELGYETGSGVIVGLPGQTLESLAEDIILMKELELDMLGVGPFIPHPETPLKDAPIGNPLITLKTLAIMRILLPKANIPATTALRTISPELGIKALQAGANVVMPDITPEKYRTFYEIYPGKGQSKGSYEFWKNFLNSIGMTGC
ncbi:[FeFe] hydrogenase H-cluster radical SAM maturase HydE [Thermodesulfovibrio sp. 3907-1M]|uniref:[FeFe] hydrogenase H-cluster radical SAM maturase HydE n=1 Tax=Thermodesulfovibrio autotrophicus TaxID=3118333 RepID=A0AAU8GZE9_9BACT